MKIKIGNVQFELAAWLVVLALTVIVITAVICATNNFQSLEMGAHFNLRARDQKSEIRSQPVSTNLTPSMNLTRPHAVQ